MAQDLFHQELYERSKILKIITISNADEMEFFIKKMLAECKDNVIGFDTEWKPNYNKDQCNPISIIQLSSNDLCLIIHISNMLQWTKREELKTLIDLLENPYILKVGVGLSEDIIGLKRDYSIDCKGFHDNILTCK